MTSLIKKIVLALDDSLFRVWVKWCWPEYKRPRKGYMYHYQVIKQYFFFQKILRINGAVPWPVDFRSKVVDWPGIEKGICCDPGDNLGIYINASGGIKMGFNVHIGPNSTLTSTNHYKYDHRQKSHTKGISIGNNVWIGSNCNIVAGAKIGDNVTIGAGCYIKGEIPANSTVVVSNNALEITPKKRDYEWDCRDEELL